MRKISFLKSLIFLFITVLLFQQQGIAQFPQTLFPVGVFGDPYADTLLNTRDIVMRAGIKSISAWQTPPNLLRSFVSKTVYLNEVGNITSIRFCFEKKNDSFSGCMGDTLSYDSQKRLVSMSLKDGQGDVYQLWTVEFPGEGEVRYTSSGKSITDTSTMYKYFNIKGQMVGLKHVIKGQHPQEQDFLLYYNADGLPDSIKHTAPAGPVDFFKRTIKGKRKEIVMENAQASFKWIYNLSGQCLSSEYTVKKQPGNTSKTKTRYYYNTDGTLSTVTDEYGNRPKTTTFYSYSRY